MLPSPPANCHLCALHPRARVAAPHLLQPVLELPKGAAADGKGRKGAPPRVAVAGEKTAISVHSTPALASPRHSSSGCFSCCPRAPPPTGRAARARRLASPSPSPVPGSSGRLPSPARRRPSPCTPPRRWRRGATPPAASRAAQGRRRDGKGRKGAPPGKGLVEIEDMEEGLLDDEDHTRVVPKRCYSFLVFIVGFVALFSFSFIPHPSVPLLLQRGEPPIPICLSDATTQTMQPVSSAVERPKSSCAEPVSGKAKGGLPSIRKQQQDEIQLGKRV
ncbi:hypothetical protein ACP4OV_012219 [Aristida adscensionis]